MESIYERSDINHKIIMMTVVVIAFFAFFFIEFILKPIKGDEKIVNMPYRNWSWTIRLLRQIIPGTVVLVITILFLIADIKLIRYKYLCHIEKYSAIEGEIRALVIEDGYRWLDEDEYYCTFELSDKEFEIVLEKEWIEELKESAIIRVCWVEGYSFNSIWKIEKVK